MPHGTTAAQRQDRHSPCSAGRRRTAGVMRGLNQSWASPSVEEASLRRRRTRVLPDCPTISAI
ncbi:hypothetical protein J4732_07290 [Serratia marcescens]|uniref:Uncharacterized protein n=1 Tax=Serratia marcescens TaxID=615 RepID=A0A939NQ85_SERMA|nr:hypothetical protein [Serratia marcescens]